MIILGLGARNYKISFLLSEIITLLMLQNKRKIIMIFFILSFGVNAQQDSVSNGYSNIVKLNLSKILTNELAIAYELKSKDIATELEVGYIYPTMNKNNILSSLCVDFIGFPELYYEGISTCLFLKQYKSNNFYRGFSAILKYAYFNNKWVWGGGFSGDDNAPNINCSQKRYAFGVAYRIGYMTKKKRFFFDRYFAFGVRLINSKTSYNYYKLGNYSDVIFYGKPGKGIFNDNGLFCYPFLNLGFKFGLGWKNIHS